MIHTIVQNMQKQKFKKDKVIVKNNLKILMNNYKNKFLKIAYFISKMQLNFY